MNTVPRTVFLDQVSHSGRVMLKVVQVRLHSKGRILDTYAILDDESERTIILPTAVHYLDWIRQMNLNQELNIAKQSCPVEILKHKFAHLRDVPILPFKEVQPMLLIGSDYPQLITPIDPVLMGPLGSPVQLVHIGAVPSRVQLPSYISHWRLPV